MKGVISAPADEPTIKPAKGAIQAPDISWIECFCLVILKEELNAMAENGNHDSLHGMEDSEANDVSHYCSQEPERPSEE